MHRPRRPAIRPQEWYSQLLTGYRDALARLYRARAAPFYR